jgi:hypothetical protein
MVEGGADDEFQTILGCGEFSPPLHRLLWELLEWHAGVEPISHRPANTKTLCPFAIADSTSFVVVVANHINDHRAG